MANGHQQVFGAFRLDPVQQQLWQGENVVELQPKPLSVLQYLAERPGRVVTKEELLQKVWAGTYVTKAALKVCIQAIRKALGEEAATPYYIETVGREGYRFLGDGQNRTPEPAGEKSSLALPVVVGREAELDQLHQWLTTALDGQRQCVFVTGESGIGKTAVVDLFHNQIRTLGSLSIGRGQCVEQYGEGEAYLPVLEAMGRLCQEAGGAQLVTLLRQYAPTWLVQLPGVIDEAERMSLQAQTQGTTQKRMLRVMAEVVEQATARRPLVLILEDLQWSDPSTLELLAYLARRRERARFLVIGTYRPIDVVMSQHPVKEMKQELQAHGQCQELRVAFLTDRHISTYLTGRFPNTSVPHALVDAIHRRTNGNALFMVNIVEELISQQVLVWEDGNWTLRGDLETLSTPESVRQLIERQVKRLGSEQQRVLEVASVAGTEFTVAAVAVGLKSDIDTVEEICEELAGQGQFIEEIGVAEWPDGTLSGHYAFRHALYQEVLYGQLGETRRLRLHRLIGDCVEAAYQAQAGELAAELALHFERGRDYPRAVQYLQQAADNARKRHAYQETILHFRRALDILPNLPDTPERDHQELLLQIALGGALTALKGFGPPEVEKAYSRARELCQQMGETPQLFPVLWGLESFYMARGEIETAHLLGEQCFTLAQGVNDSALLLQAHLGLGREKLFLGDFSSALDHLTQGAALYDRDTHHAHAFVYRSDPGVECLMRAGDTLWYLGYPDQSLKKGLDALRLAREVNHSASILIALNYATLPYFHRRDVQGTQEKAAELIALGQEYGFALALPLGKIFQGWVLTERGRVEEGIEELRQGLEMLRATGTEVLRPSFLLALVEAYGKADRPADAHVLLNELLPVVQKSEKYSWAAEVYRVTGELSRQAQRLPEAEAALHKALDVARRQHARSLELRAATSLARVWQQQGKTSEANTLLAEIYNWFTEGFKTKDLQEAKSLLEELS